MAAPPRALDQHALSRPQEHYRWFTRTQQIARMLSLLEQVVEDLRSLSREEQDRVAEVVLAFLDGSQDDFRLRA
jgi:hypothetical protein